MKKILLLLVFLLSLATSSKSCDKSWDLQKTKCIIDSIVRRLQKTPYDYSEEEIINILGLFKSQHGLACYLCKEKYELMCLGGIDYLIRHMKVYKK